MGKFKIGDRVIATKTFADITAGDGYTVVEVDHSDDDMPIRVVDDAGDRYWLYSNQFRILTPAITIAAGKFYRTRSGKPTGRVTVGFGGFEAVVDGHVRIFDKAGGAIYSDDDIVEAWVPKVGERVRFIQDYDHEVAGQSAIVIDVPPTSWAFRVRLERDGDESTELRESLEPLPVAPQPAALKIEAGRYYKTRDGRKVGPMEKYDSDSWSAVGCGHLWTDKGERYFEIDRGGPTDLITEWQETANVGAQVDTLAEEYGSAPASNDTPERKLVRTGQGYGYELARFGDYVWVDTGKTAPITLRADKIAA